MNSIAGASDHINHKRIIHNTGQSVVEFVPVPMHDIYDPSTTSRCKPSRIPTCMSASHFIRNSQDQLSQDDHRLILHIDIMILKEELCAMRCGLPGFNL